MQLLLSYASPHMAVQARIEMTRVYLALSDAAGARTLMREIDKYSRGGLTWAPWSAKPGSYAPGSPPSTASAPPELRRWPPPSSAYCRRCPRT